MSSDTILVLMYVSETSLGVISDVFYIEMCLRMRL